MSGFLYTVIVNQKGKIKLLNHKKLGQMRPLLTPPPPPLLLLAAAGVEPSTA